jgi:hypothetical protein
LYRVINDFKKGYQATINIAKDEKVDLVRHSHRIRLGGGNISQLLKVHGVIDVRQTEIHTTEPFVLEPSALISSWLFKS